MQAFLDDGTAVSVDSGDFYARIRRSSLLLAAAVEQIPFPADLKNHDRFMELGDLMERLDDALAVAKGLGARQPAA